jgi:hypothetical protein
VTHDEDDADDADEKGGYVLGNSRSAKKRLSGTLQQEVILANGPFVASHVTFLR